MKFDNFLLARVFQTLSRVHCYGDDEMSDDEVKWRSEPLEYIELILPDDLCREALYEFGSLQMLQLLDENQHLMNKTLRPCVYELQAMEEMERKWKLIASEIHAERLPLAQSAEPVAVAVAVGDRPTPRLDDIQDELERISSEVVHTRQNYTELAVQQQRIEEYMNSARLSLAYLRRDASSAPSHSQSSSSSSTQRSQTSIQMSDLSSNRPLLPTGLKQPSSSEQVDRLVASLKHPPWWSDKSAGADNDAKLASPPAHRPSSFISPTFFPKSDDPAADQFPVQSDAPQDESLSAVISAVRSVLEENGVPTTVPKETASSSFSFFGFISGVIESDAAPSLERMLYRATRGNSVVRFVDIDLAHRSFCPRTGRALEQSVVMICYSGQASRRRIERACESMECRLYPLPDVASAQDELFHRLETEYVQLSSILDQTHLQRRKQLAYAASRLEHWSSRMEQERAVLVAMNLLKHDLGKRCWVGHAWVSVQDMPQLAIAVANARRRAPHAMSAIVRAVPHPNSDDSDGVHSAAGVVRPTLLRVGESLSAFYSIVDTYGTPAYGELHPGVLTVITFPFLFAVMFGDVGHGAILTLFALYLFQSTSSGASSYAQRARDAADWMSSLRPARFLLLLCGIFSIYVGFIYNECFSVALHIFPSAWTFTHPTAGETHVELSPTYVYPIGMDPAWRGSTTELAFSNSHKMKVSIILGVVHMLGGILVSALNALHFGRVSDLFTEIAPRFLFMSAIFGYMCLMILIKWSIDWQYSATPPPSLIGELISMVLHGGSSTDALFRGQGVLEVLLLFTAGIAAPWMLFGKPALVWFRHRRSAMRKRASDTSLHRRYEEEIDLITGDALPLGRLSTMQDTLKPRRPSSRPTSRPSSDAEDDDESTSLLGRARAIEARFEKPIEPEVPIVDPVEPECACATSLARSEYPHGKDDGHDDAHDFSDLMIHQVIHTIEFLLGSLSNTASYLRLWALSLAHSQLSEVFWRYLVHGPWKALTHPVEKPSVFTAPLFFVSISMWFGLTLGVLMMMESLSACLHALRLHWVEFQNKFYAGTGVPFVAFTLHVDEAHALRFENIAGFEPSESRSVDDRPSANGPTGTAHHAAFVQSIREMLTER